MKQALATAVMTSIEAFLQVPGTQLQHIELTLRRLLADLRNAGVEIPAELDDLIEEAAIAHLEDIAHMNEVDYDGDEEYYRRKYYEKYGCYPGDNEEQTSCIF